MAGRSQGTTGTAVNVEASCSPAQPQADAFQNSLDGFDSQDLDGDGAACGINAGYALGLAEGTGSDTVDALGRDPCLVVDLNCDGQPENPVYLSLAPNSPTLGTIGASAADVLATGDDYTIAPNPAIIPAGSMTAMIVITVANDEVDESDETVILVMDTVLHAATGVTRIHTATILDNDPPRAYLPVLMKNSPTRP